MAGDTTQAESLAHRLRETLPTGHPDAVALAAAIQAQLALDRKNRPRLNALQPAARIELASMPFGNNISCLYPVYVRGGHNLATGQGNAAYRVSEDSRSQRDRLELLDGSVSASGSGSCQCCAVREPRRERMPDAARVRARAAYKDFLTLWKDADPDIPILKQARPGMRS